MAVISSWLINFDWCIVSDFYYWNDSHLSVELAKIVQVAILSGDICSRALELLDPVFENESFKLIMIVNSWALSSQKQLSNPVPTCMANHLSCTVLNARSWWLKFSSYPDNTFIKEYEVDSWDMRSIKWAMIVRLRACFVCANCTMIPGPAVKGAPVVHFWAFEVRHDFADCRLDIKSVHHLPGSSSIAD